MARKRKGKSRLEMSTGQAKLLDSASGQVSFKYNMRYIYHCEYLVKEWDTQQYINGEHRAFSKVKITVSYVCYHHHNET